MIHLAPFIEGVGAEQIQQARATQLLRASLVNDAVAGSLHGPLRGRRLARIDVRSPQVFTRHPELPNLAPVVQLAHPDTIPPAAGWDGEPGPAPWEW